MPKSASDASVAVGRDARAGLADPAPEQPGAAGLQHQQQNGEAGDKIFLKLLAGVAGGETSGVLRFKQRGAPAAGQFLEFQFFHPLVFLQPHLEPAHEGHEHAEAEKDHRRLPGQRSGEHRDAKARQKYHQRHREVHQPVFLNVAFHD